MTNMKKTTKSEALNLNSIIMLLLTVVPPYPILFNKDDRLAASKTENISTKL